MKPGVLFVCYGNSCRSIMAEAIARHKLGGRIEVFSAGISPLGKVSDDSLRALQELGISCTGLKSRGFNAIPFERIHMVVNLLHHPINGLLPLEFRGIVLDVPTSDPFKQGMEAFRFSRDTLVQWIAEKLPRVIDEAGYPSK